MDYETLLARCEDMDRDQRDDFIEMLVEQQILALRHAREAISIIHQVERELILRTNERMKREPV